MQLQAYVSTSNLLSSDEVGRYTVSGFCSVYLNSVNCLQVILFLSKIFYITFHNSLFCLPTRV